MPRICTSGAIAADSTRALKVTDECLAPFRVSPVTELVVRVPVLTSPRRSR